MKEIVRFGLKVYIKIIYKFFSLISTESYDFLFFEDFNESSTELINALPSGYTWKLITNKASLNTKIKAITAASVVYTDNTNIIFAGLPKIKQYVILYWHASAAIKKFGIPTLTTKYQRIFRLNDYKAYQKITVSSELMAKAFIDAFNCKSNVIEKCGSPIGDRVINWDENNITTSKPYILYVPTFRNNKDANDQVKQLILNWESPICDLYYSIHPSLDFSYENSSVKQIRGDQIYKYSSGANLVISDYSSLLVDTSILNNKIVLYGFDYEEYVMENGLNLNVDQFWGKVIYSQSELQEYIESSIYKSHNIQDVKNRYYKYNTAKSINKIIDLGVNYVRTN